MRLSSQTEEISFADEGDDADEEDDEAEPNDGSAFRVAIQHFLSINQPMRLISSPRSRRAEAKKKKKSIHARTAFNSLFIIRLAREKSFFPDKKWWEGNAKHASPYRFLIRSKSTWARLQLCIYFIFESISSLGGIQFEYFIHADNNRLFNHSVWGADLADLMADAHE